MKKNPIANILERREWLFVLLILIIGTALRILFIANLPLGLNQDEASSGYEAFSLLSYGVDRNLNLWPVLLESWGSGQNALYSYLSIPFVAIFGLNVFSTRIVSALFGSLTLLVFWLTARRCRGKGFAMTALFLLAVNPWHIMISRWALESNLLPFFLLLGIYLVMLAKDKPWILCPASLAFGLSLYAYGMAFFFLPLFLIAAVVWLAKNDAIKPLSFSLALGIFVFVAFPITLCQFINMIGGESVRLFGITIPKLTESRQMATTIFGSSGMSPVQNFKSFLQLLWTQSDGLSFNSMKYYGLYYFFGLPLVAVGFAASLGTRKDHPGEILIGIALVISFIVSFFIDVNINRMNMAFLPIIYFSAVGLHIILRKTGVYGVIPVMGILICCAMFINSYRYSFGVKGNEHYFPGLGDALEFLDTVDPDSVVVTNYVNQPYIFVLFYTEASPYDFAESANYVNKNAAFRQVKRFGNYEFEHMDSDADAYILHYTETGSRQIILRFHSYVLCR